MRKLAAPAWNEPDRLLVESVHVDTRFEDRINVSFVLPALIGQTYEIGGCWISG